MKLWFKRVLIGMSVPAILCIVVLGIPYDISKSGHVFSTVLQSKSGELLSAQIADDGQWRFPIIQQVPNKIKTAILTFEDKRFYNHCGVDFLAIGRALRLNIQQKKIVSGGSTVTMQLARILDENQPRTYTQKVKEVIAAFRIDWQYSKDEILKDYLSFAPFGGNVVGVETAAWRYYSKPVDQLSWAEAATLAVLPNAPGLIHPNRNRNDLMEKRNALLMRLLGNGSIDLETYEVSIEEPLPNQVYALPNLAPHLLEYMKLSSDSITGLKRTTIDLQLQNNLIEIGNAKYQQFSQSGIENIAICVVENKTGDIIGYLGNSPVSDQENAVDMIRAPRSSGSILKPFLYALMINEGLLSPSSIVKDIPVYLDGFSPSNYNKTYAGVVPADQALSQSLNIPFVLMLKEYGVQKFHYNLKKLGSRTLHNPPSHYGLSLILGGAEVTLIDLVRMYGAMAHKLTMTHNDIDQWVLKYTDHNIDDNGGKFFAELNRAAIYSTFEAMSRLSRPNERGNWQNFTSSQKVAWKTGTSYGHRDAWAVGVTPNHTIGVWVGNADGEGREEIIGVSTAGPVLFDVLQQLPEDHSWFEPPYVEMEFMPVCVVSGMLPTRYCDEQDTVLLPRITEQSDVCPYHKQIVIDSISGYQIGMGCSNRSTTIAKNYFVLPPQVSNYYQDANPFYQDEPELDPKCTSSKHEIGIMEIVYPSHSEKILLPRGLGAEKQKVVFEIAHKINDAKIFWYVNETYVGETSVQHKIAINLKPNNYHLLGVDDAGNRVAINFEIVGTK